jgi:hypothetical protein
MEKNGRGRMVAHSSGWKARKELRSELGPVPPLPKIRSASEMVCRRPIAPTEACTELHRPCWCRPSWRLRISTWWPRYCRLLEGRPLWCWFSFSCRPHGSLLVDVWGQCNGGANCCTQGLQELSNQHVRGSDGCHQPDDGILTGMLISSECIGLCSRCYGLQGE